MNATAPIMMARAVVPHMLSARQGRIITVTTSLGTMVRGGYLLYGASKAAAEAAMAGLAADLEGTGVTSNVLVPGGVTNTPLVGEDAGDRSKMLQPEIMVPPLLWLVSDAAAGVNARRFIAADWDRSLPAEQAAEKAGARSPGWESRGCRSSRPEPPPRHLGHALDRGFCLAAGASCFSRASDGRLASPLAPMHSNQWIAFMSHARGARATSRRTRRHALSRLARRALRAMLAAPLAMRILVGALVILAAWSAVNCVYQVVRN